FNQPQEILVDRVIAVVGDTILLYSTVFNEMARLRAEGAIPPTATSAQLDQFARQITEAQVNEMLILTAAKQANVTVTDQDVAATVENRIRGVEQDIGSPEALREALAAEGRTMAGFRRDVLEQERAVAIRQRYL